MTLYDDFGGYMIHTCTVVAGKLSTSGYGTEHVEWAVASGATEYPLVPCRRVTNLIFPGKVNAGGSSTLIYNIYIPCGAVPANFGLPGSELHYRIKDIVTSSGTDAGPYDITIVIDEAGTGHHYRATLTRTT